MSHKNIVRDSTLNRSCLLLALKAYVSSGRSVKKPVHCSDLTGSAEENGLRWKSELGNKVEVTVNIKDPSSNAKTIQEKCEEKQVLVSEMKQYVFIESVEFNFIYIECTTESSTYFDSVFRNLPRNGVFAITSWDDPAMFACPPEPALRNYSGHITRTFYASELAIRLILSEMARSAARYGKAIEVLFSALLKSSITIIVSVKKGSSHAVNCVQQIKSLVHCMNCEERIFFSDNGFIKDSPVNLLKCDCKKNSGSISLKLGPVWSGPIASLGFVQDMLYNITTESRQVKTCLLQIIEETRCDSLITKNTRKEYVSKQSVNTTEENVANDETKMDVDRIDEYYKRRKDNENSSNEHAESENSLNSDFVKSGKKRLRLTENCETELAPAPAFYYNLHKHSPKGPQLEKISKVIEILQQNGFRASRTHFDPGAVKTNANLPQLQSVLTISS